MDIHSSEGGHSFTAFLLCSGETGGHFQCAEDVISNSATSSIVFIADAGPHWSVLTIALFCR